MKYNIHIGWFCAVLISISNLAYTQNSITGKVIDESGVPMPGVNVMEKSTTNGTATDIDGKSTLEVQDSATVVFSFIGYVKQEIPINGQTTIDVTIQPDFTTLDEVVVVGYGTQKRSDVTGAVASLDPKVLKDRPITNIEEALQGQVTGLNISSTGGQPGAATKMNIRGISSVRGS